MVIIIIGLYNQKLQPLSLFYRSDMTSVNWILNFSFRLNCDHFATYTAELLHQYQIYKRGISDMQIFGQLDLEKGHSDGEGHICWYGNANTNPNTMKVKVKQLYGIYRTDHSRNRSV